MGLSNLTPIFDKGLSSKSKTTFPRLPLGGPLYMRLLSKIITKNKNNFTLFGKQYKQKKATILSLITQSVDIILMKLKAKQVLGQ